MKWAVGDVHGCFNHLMTLLRKINFNNSVDQLYMVGDIVDRGPLIKDTINWVMDGSSKGFVKMVRGNHEENIIRHILQGDGFFDLDKATMQQMSEFELNRFANWANNLPYMIEERYFIMTHGGMKSFIELDRQLMEDLIWSRDQTLIPESYRKNKTIIHGHTVQKDPLIRTDRCNIDCGCVFGNKLTALLLDDLPNTPTVVSVTFEEV